jgi:carboxypeptidase PM20D1
VDANGSWLCQLEVGQIRRCEILEERQLPASIEGVPRQTLEYIGPEMPFGKRLVMANLWLFKPLVERKLAASPATNAGIRKTAATIT